jgi:hypothetical protein
MTAWQPYSHPGFALRWRYPNPSPGGQPVEVVEEQQAAFTRVHLLSTDRDEVYFEVRRFVELEEAAAHYARHRASLEAQFAQQAFAISDLTPVTLAGQSAHAYTFRWDDRERAALLIVIERALYRVIYNPCSAVNAAILATVAANSA